MKREVKQGDIVLKTQILEEVRPPGWLGWLDSWVGWDGRNGRNGWDSRMVGIAGWLG